MSRPWRTGGSLADDGRNRSAPPRGWASLTKRSRARQLRAEQVDVNLGRIGLAVPRSGSCGITVYELAFSLPDVCKWGRVCTDDEERAAHRNHDQTSTGNVREPPRALGEYRVE